MDVLKWFAIFGLLICIAWFLVRKYSRAAGSGARSSLSLHEVLERKRLPESTATPRLDNILYSHGGFMGASVECLRFPVCVKQLESSCPEVCKSLVAYLDQATDVESGKIQALMENNPVLAAFGSRETAAKPLIMEWDIYLDTSTDSAMARLISEELDFRADSPSFAPSPSARMTKIINHLLDSTIVAHGSILDRVCEKLFGLSRHAKMWDETGGMSIRRWLAIYNEAGGLPLCKGVFLDVKSTKATQGQLLLLTESISSLGIFVWGVGSFAFHHLGSVAGKPQEIGAPPPATPHGILPGGAEIGGGEVVLAAASPSVLFPPPLPIYLLTHIAELPPLLKKERGGIPRGAAVLFNGGSMLKVQKAAGASEYAVEGVREEGRISTIHASLLDELRALVEEYDLKLGYYVQETSLGVRGASTLIEMANAHPKIFPLGFACSNLPERISEDIDPFSTGFSLPFWAHWLFPSWKQGAIGKARLNEH